MGRIVTQIHISNFEDKTKSIDASALIDTGAAYLTLPAIWRDRLGELEKIADVEVEMADQSVKKAGLYGPVRLQISKFRKTFTEVLFLEMSKINLLQLVNHHYENLLQIEGQNLLPYL